jgi:DNA-binding transcriptional regulator YhcF (GntR family)
VNDEQRAVVERWRRSNSSAESVAAQMAAGIDENHLTHLPSTEDIAGKYGVSVHLAAAVKRLLGDAHIIKKDKANRYFIPS